MEADISVQVTFGFFIEKSISLESMYQDRSEENKTQTLLFGCKMLTVGLLFHLMTQDKDLLLVGQIHLYMCIDRGIVYISICVYMMHFSL